VFGWFTTADEASWAAHAMQVAFAGAGLGSDVYVSPVNGPRAEVVA
jgi:homoserine kinase